MRISTVKNVLCAFMLICFSQLFIAQQVKAGTPLAPDATASAFYNWYLHSLSTDRDPLRDDKIQLSAYVSKALIKEIERQINSANGLDADYFIQAQDYFDDWLTHISVTKPAINGDTASVVVTLGATKESSWKLAVALKKECGIWKIRKVRALQT